MALKFLLDQLFAKVTNAQINVILANFGWTREDYARGYILQVSLLRRPFVIFYFFLFLNIFFLLSITQVTVTCANISVFCLRVVSA